MKPEILKWVKILVWRTVREKNLAYLDFDVLLSAGYLGYTQSLKRFDPERNVKFKTFAEYRVKGAVLDEVRKLIGDERCKNKRPAQAANYDMALASDNGEAISKVESYMTVDKFFADIPLGQRDKDILKCRVAGMNLREIGKKFSFSESRASQLLAEIKKEIYPWFREYLGSNFKVSKYKCHECGHLNEIASFTTRFDCDKCCTEIILEASNNA